VIIPMAIRPYCLLLAACAALSACHQRESAAPQAKAEQTIHLVEHGTPFASGTRTLYQLNNEPPIVVVSDGRGGPPLLYRGQPLNPNQIKSIQILKKREARERFGDQTLDAAIFIELK
jgi:hypothetical protein